MTSRRYLATAALLLAVSALLYFVLPRSAKVVEEEMADRGSPEMGPSLGGGAGVTDDSDLDRPESDPHSYSGPPSPLDKLRSPDATAQDDVRLLALLFADYASVFKRVPLGTHQEIVAALRGDNSRAIEYIPAGHPAVNAENEITDRWNKPFFFHVISRTAVEVVSAGSDGVLFTDDDVRDTPPHASVEPVLSMAP